ncbi:uncharacterized protein L969DRAFT_18686 [Mixia osmundae IAM 14324]|uniref:uncharacterized protein n=1 Tax=Mixia osmundae (strain CBS 9802 / IAM 14324 / JCM 22182 / KY 12970) TaxID=764103 RepID=UPI0004A55032|nr:uncharacterized protein L969DRAFT_18686 [Mixia osmundae IAM 14324]KEI37896.1 hypothetical protein L969DRAFT_18686 [Mixia osmundae IAM 14324]
MVKPEPVMMADEQRLNELGLKQDLDRSWGLLQNFGASFSIISVITGLTTLFEYGLLTGGPVDGSSAASSSCWSAVPWQRSSLRYPHPAGELMHWDKHPRSIDASHLPFVNSPYAFAAYLSAPRYAPVAAYTTGWFNFLGQVAVTTGIDFGLAGLISTTASVKGYEPTAAKTIAILAGVLILQGIINTLGVRSLKYWNNASIILHSAGVFSLCIAVLVKAPKLQPAKFLTYFYDGTGAEGYEGWSQRGSVAYIGVIGLLQATYTLTGYDERSYNMLLRRFC